MSTSKLFLIQKMDIRRVLERMRGFQFPVYRSLIGCFVLGCSFATAAAAGPVQAADGKPASRSRGTAVAYPWVLIKGHTTSRSHAMASIEEVIRKADYASIPGDVAKAAWKAQGLPIPTAGKMPSRASLRTYGRALKVKKVLYGSISWHTRSIWVNVGPKTISTATINAYVYDVASNTITYSKKLVKARSDERSSNYKIAAAVLFTPLVTAVSGGPATPREQRAAQIGVGMAFAPWVKASSTSQ